MSLPQHRTANVPRWRPAAPSEGWKALWPPPVGLLLLWGGLWLNLNTGPWLVEHGRGADEITFVRVYAPFGVLGAAVIWLAFAQWRKRNAFQSPLVLLGVYGLAGLAAGVAWSPGPEYARYWSVAYLATVSVGLFAVRSRDPLRNAFALLLATWVVTAVVAAGITGKGSAVIFGDAPSAYWVTGALQGASRSSGVARWTGVTALVAVVWAFYFRRWVSRAALLGIAGVGLYVVYRVQSRGAVFGMVAAILFLLCLEKQRRRWALPLLALAVACMVMLDAEQVVREKVMNYLKRGAKSEQNLYTMGGRTQTYEQGWKLFLEEPVFGRGFWGDRLSGIGHAHNGVLEALLVAGTVGFIPYFWSWIAGWRSFLRLWRRRRWLPRQHLSQLTACGAVLAFFTLRAIPETTGAAYEPDLLILCAVYAYLEGLGRAGVYSSQSIFRQVSKPAGSAQRALQKR